MLMETKPHTIPNKIQNKKQKELAIWRDDGKGLVKLTIFISGWQGGEWVVNKESFKFGNSIQGHSDLYPSPVIVLTLLLCVQYSKKH